MSSRSVIVALVLCSGFWTLSSQADFRESYKAGLEALEAERWEAAERFFSAAVAERSEERFNALLGRRYFPHYYLGVARSEQGKCQTALAAFRESEGQGKLQRVPDLVKDVAARRKACKDRKAAVETQAASVMELLEQASDALESLEQAKKNPQLANLWAQGPNSFQQRQQGLEGQYGQLQAQLQASKERQSTDDLRSVETLAQKLLVDVERTIADARTELGDRNAVAAGLLAKVEALEVKARSQLRGVRDLAPYPTTLGRRVRAVEGLLSEIKAGKDSAKASQLSRFQEDLDSAMKQLTSAARRPPRVLQDAVESFLAGDYEDVLDRLEGAGLGGDLGQAQGCLLRSAARFYLFILGGEEAIELEAQAIDDLRGCTADALQPPSERFFSPRFLRFFERALQDPESDTLEELDGSEDTFGETLGDVSSGD